MMKAKTAHYGNVLQLETQKRLAYLAILGLSQRFVRGIFHPVWHYLILISPLCSGSASCPFIEKACQPPTQSYGYWEYLFASGAFLLSFNAE